MAEGTAPGNQDWASPSASGISSPTTTPSPQVAPYRPTVAQQAPTVTFRSWQPGIVALRPLSFGDFLVVPFRAMRFNRAVMIGTPLLLATASSLLTVLALWLAFQDPRLDITSSNGGGSGVTAPTVIVAVIAVLSWLATDLFASAILVPAVARAFLGERITIKQAFAKVRPRIGALIVIDLILFGIVAVYTVVIAFAMVGLTAADDSGALALVASTFGQWLFVPLAAVLGVYLPAVKGAMILEGAGPRRSIARSLKLIPGRFWWTILILLVVRTVVGFVEQFSLGIGFIAGLFVAFAPDTNPVILVVIALLIAVALIVTCILEYSLAGSVNALIYLDLRMRKEGLAFDMARAAEASHYAQQRVIG